MIRNYFAEMNGTSGSAPIVSGVAGLILSLNPSLTAAEVQDILQNTADDVNGGGYDVDMGYGRVNAYRAVQAVTPSGFTISGNALSSIYLWMRHQCNRWHGFYSFESTGFGLTWGGGL
jgi:subtilisin family serine protease